MDCTRRELLAGFWRPDFWPDQKAAAKDFPPGQDIALSREQCIAWGRGVCSECEKVCPEQALLFIGGLHPRLLTARCTLCGDCVPVCPTEAIALRPGALAPNPQGGTG